MPKIYSKIASKYRDIINCFIVTYTIRYAIATSFFIHFNMIIIVVYISNCFHIINRSLSIFNKINNNNNNNRYELMIEFIHHHNDLCRWISKIDLYFGIFHIVTLSIHLPIIVLSVNALLSLKSLFVWRSILLSIVTIIEMFILLSTMALMIPINQYAMAGRLPFYSCLTRGGGGFFYRCGLQGRRNYPRGLYSFIRFQLKCQNYLERFASRYIDIGIHIRSHCITHANFWNFILIYVSYFLLVYKTLYC
ncbi:hypothetical protein HUG17_3061 [Dermatophagoides farinae]|uniref:Uncharacterized protein n=1 Tax=Dermatophagoides farinae TaxID=6954 RepID=A0A9D4NVD5_DERFA|nr:hypothetical protein HUG17_3061 [Dermatophagoides farinae]